MCDITLKLLFEVKPEGFDTYLRLYQSEQTPSAFYIKQLEINKILEYCRGCVSCEIDDSLIIKLHDESGKLMNFIELSMCQDYILCLPTIGKRRELARNLNTFFRNFRKILSSIDGLQEVTKAFDTREITDTNKPREIKDTSAVDRLNEIISRQKKEIETLTNRIDLLCCAFLDYQSTLETLLKKEA